MEPTKFGDQPLISVMRETRWSYSLLALEIGVTYKQLYAPARGWTTPSVHLRSRLPIVLGRPLTDLFTEESLAATPAISGPPPRAYLGGAR